MTRAPASDRTKGPRVQSASRDSSMSARSRRLHALARLGSNLPACHRTTDQASKRPEHFVRADGNDTSVSDPNLFVPFAMSRRKSKMSNCDRCHISSRNRMLRFVSTGRRICFFRSSSQGWFGKVSKFLQIPEFCKFNGASAGRLRKRHLRVRLIAGIGALQACALEQ